MNWIEWKWDCQESLEWTAVFNPGTHDDDFEDHQTVVSFTSIHNDLGADAWDCEIELPRRLDDPLYNAAQHADAVIAMIQDFLAKRNCDCLRFGSKQNCKLFDQIIAAHKAGKFEGRTIDIDYGGQLWL